MTRNRYGAKQIAFTLVGILTLAFTGWNALAAIDASDISELNAAVEPRGNTSDLVNKKIDDWFQKRSLLPGIRSESGNIYYSASAAVSATPESNTWSRARQSAFTKALNEARAKFILDKFGNVRMSSNNNSSQDSSSGASGTDANMCAMGEFESYWEKVKALTGAKLDQALVNAGVDPEQYKSDPEERQKELFYDAAITKTLETASGEISGLIPVQTFEGRSENGVTVIGVIVMYSPKLYVLAEDLRNGREPTLSGKKAGRPLQYFTDRPAEQLKDMMGLRIVFDEENRPLLLSYGQWGYAYKGNDARSMERHRLNAYKQADIRSLEALSEFINGRLQIRNETESGEIIREYISMHCKEGNLVQRDGSDEQMIDRLSGQLEIRASAKVAGTTEVKRWSYSNKYGQDMIGVVRAWTLDGLNSAAQIKDPESRMPATQKPTKQTYSATVTISKESMNPEEDF